MKKIFFIIFILLLLNTSLSLFKVLADSSAESTTYFVKWNKANNSVKLYSSTSKSGMQEKLHYLGEHNRSNFSANNLSSVNLIVGDFILVEGGCVNSAPPCCEISGYTFHDNGQALKYKGAYCGFEPSEENKRITQQTNGSWEKTGSNLFTVRWD
jgi:hypothetical protein